MRTDYQVAVSADVAAAPETVYAVLADYRKGHPAILPPRFFTALEVTNGGRGAGTKATVRMNVLGAKQTYHLVVTEPQPGRLLQEKDAKAGVTTTFLVEPTRGGSRVTITTRARTSPGMRGMVERWVNPLVTRRIYCAQLARLDAYVRGQWSPHQTSEALQQGKEGK